MAGKKGVSDNAKQLLFIEAYIETMNPIESAKRAGYSHPDKQAYRILECENVKTALKERRDELMLRHGINADAVLKEYSRIAFSSLQDIFTISGNSIVLKKDADLSLLSEVSETKYGIRIKLHNKTGALDALSKHLGLFEADNDQLGKGIGKGLREQIEAGHRDAKIGDNHE